MRTYLSCLILLIYFVAAVPVTAQSAANEVDKFEFAGVPYSFEYPAHWVTDEQIGFAFVGDTPAALTSLTTQSPTDHIVMWAAPVEILYFYWDMHGEPDNVADMAKQIGEYASDPRVIDWKFDQAAPITLSNQRPAVISTGYDREKKSAASFIVVEYDKRFIVLFSEGPDTTTAKLQALVTHAADTLKIGNEVSLEHAVSKGSQHVSLPATFGLTTNGTSLYALVYGCDTCSVGLVRLSLQGTILEKKDKFLPLATNDFAVNSDGTFWATTNHQSAQTYDVVHLSKDGTIIKSLGLKEMRPPQIRVGADGKLYLEISREIKLAATASLDQVGDKASEEWVQVRDSTGMLLKEFLVKKEGNPLRYGTDGMTLDAQGNIYLIFSQTNKGVVIYQPTGQLVKEGFARGKVMLQDTGAFDIVKDGTVFLSVSINNDAIKSQWVVLHLDRDGKLLGIFPAKTLGIADGFTPVHFVELDNGQTLIIAANFQAGIQLSTIETYTDF